MRVWQRRADQNLRLTGSATIMTAIRITAKEEQNMPDNIQQYTIATTGDNHATAA